MFKEDFIAVQPKTEILKKHITYYYFYRTFDPDFQKQFYYYPHYRTGLTIYKDCNVVWDSSTRYSTPKKGETTVILTKNIKTRRIAIDYGIIDKICIAFEPLGINNFIDSQLSKVANGSLSYFNYFGESFLMLCDSVFKTSEIENKVTLLDNFFSKNFHMFEDTRLLKAIDFLLHNCEDLKIQILADMLGINRKTLNRLFQKHLCCSAQAFKQVVKFRKAIEQYQNAEFKPKFSDLAYDNLYYDQPEFINHCKELSGLPPKSFFSNIKQIGNFDIYWNIKTSRLSQTTN